VDVPGVMVDGDRVVHGRLDAGRRVIGSQGGCPLATVVDEGGVDEASCACRQGPFGGGRGSGPPVAVVDDGEVCEAGRAHRQSRVWREWGRRGHAWHWRCQWGRAWCRQGRQGHTWRRKRRERRRRGRARCG
jgi:hypothetical protein